MKVVLHPGDKEVVQVFVGWWSSWILFFHYRYQITGHFIDLVTCKKVRDLERKKNQIRKDSRISHLVTIPHDQLIVRVVNLVPRAFACLGTNLTVSHMT